MTRRENVATLLVVASAIVAAAGSGCGSSSEGTGGHGEGGGAGHSGGGGGGGTTWSCGSDAYSGAVLADAPRCYWPLETSEMGPAGVTTPEVSGNCPAPSVVGLQDGSASFAEVGVTLTAGGSIGFFGEPLPGPATSGPSKYGRPCRRPAPRRR